MTGPHGDPLSGHLPRGSGSRPDLGAIVHAEPPGRRRSLLDLVAWVQGGYFVLTGLWALVHIRSFMAVTGPKQDLWLVKTVGALVVVIGAVLLVAARTRRLGGEIMLLAVGSALALTAIDVIYVSRGTILPIYLLDAAAEVVLVIGWLVGSRRPR